MSSVLAVEGSVESGLILVKGFDSIELVSDLTSDSSVLIGVLSDEALSVDLGSVLTGVLSDVALRVDLMRFDLVLSFDFLALSFLAWSLTLSLSNLMVSSSESDPDVLGDTKWHMLAIESSLSEE